MKQVVEAAPNSKEALSVRVGKGKAKVHPLHRTLAGDSVCVV